MGGSQVPHTRKVCPFAKQLCQFYLSLLLLLKWNEGGGGVVQLQLVFHILWYQPYLLDDSYIQCKYGFQLNAAERRPFRRYVFLTMRHLIEVHFPLTIILSSHLLGTRKKFLRLRLRQDFLFFSSNRTYFNLLIVVDFNIKK